LRNADARYRSRGSTSTTARYHSTLPQYMLESMQLLAVPIQPSAFPFLSKAFPIVPAVAAAHFGYKVTAAPPTCVRICKGD
jgi:hypothetical protein